MRAKGEGSIYQRKDGRWVATVYDHAGQRRSVYARTEKAALDAKKAAERDGLPVSGSLTVSAWLEGWLDGKRVSVRTREGYTSKIRNLEPLIGHRRLDKLTAEDVEAAYKTLRKTLSERSVLHCHRVLHTALADAVRRRRIVRNPTDLVDAPRPDKYRASPFTLDDARRVLKEAATRPNGARWWLALVLGVRPAEARGLWWQQVDLDAGTLLLSHQSQRHIGNGLVRVPNTKSRRDRALPLPPPLVELLRAMTPNAGYVFTHGGKPVSPERDNQDWRELLAAAHVPYTRPYDCRHTTATLMLELGVPARVVADVLGHSTTGLTLDTYTQVPDPLMAESVRRLTAELDSPFDSSEPEHGGGSERDTERG